MEHNKVAGPDAIPIEFFQVCWEIVKEDIMEMFHDLSNGKLDVSRINYGVITLLTKVTDAEKIQQYTHMLIELLIQAKNQGVDYQTRKDSSKLNFTNSKCLHEGDEHYD